jgi:hypothetical protein
MVDALVLRREGRCCIVWPILLGARRDPTAAARHQSAQADCATKHAAWADRVISHSAPESTLHANHGFALPSSAVLASPARALEPFDTPRFRSTTLAAAPRGRVSALVRTTVVRVRTIVVARDFNRCD